MGLKPHNTITFLLLGGALLGLAACGSKREAVSRPPRRPVAEITLDELVGATTSPAPATEAEMSARARSVVEAAHKWLGTSYKYGGETRRGVDCSALVMNVYREALGLKIPRTTASQRQYAINISRNELQPGDLIFFSSNKNRNGISHVGLFIGNDRFIHASSSRGVVVSRLSEKYFMNHYHSAGRVADMALTAAETDRQTARRNEQQELQARMLDEILTATIDSIYSMPVDDDPNLAPGL